MVKVDFEIIREKVKTGDYEISVHAFERMRKRRITLDDLESAIINGDIIEQDVQAKPFPKCIFWGFTVLRNGNLITCAFSRGVIWLLAVA